MQIKAQQTTDDEFIYKALGLFVPEPMMALAGLSSGRAQGVFFFSFLCPPFSLSSAPQQQFPRTGYRQTRMRGVLLRTFGATPSPWASPLFFL